MATLVASAAVVSVIDARAASRGVAVQVRKIGAGPARKTARGLRLVDGSTGEVLTAARVPATGRTRLPPRQEAWCSRSLRWRVRAARARG